MRGDRVAFVGPNGVGKTTRSAAADGAEHADRGEVTLGTNMTLPGSIRPGPR